jgi:hypothetical protein
VGAFCHPAGGILPTDSRHLEKKFYTLKFRVLQFVSGQMMSKEARYIDNIANEPLPQHYEPQSVALKEISNKKAFPDKVAQIEAVDLNEEEITLVIRHFKTVLMECKDYPNKNKSRGNPTTFKCGKSR